MFIANCVFLAFAIDNGPFRFSIHEMVAVVVVENEQRSRTHFLFQLKKEDEESWRERERERKNEPLKFSTDNQIDFGK